MSEYGEPQSRNETILQNMLGEDYPMLEPQSRIETLLQALLGEWQTIEGNIPSVETITGTVSNRDLTFKYYDNNQELHDLTINARSITMTLYKYGKLYTGVLDIYLDFSNNNDNQLANEFSCTANINDATWVGDPPITPSQELIFGYDPTRNPISYYSFWDNMYVSYIYSIRENIKQFGFYIHSSGLKLSTPTAKRYHIYVPMRPFITK